MKKSKLLKAMQDKIQRHDLCTFMSLKDHTDQMLDVLQDFGTVEQFKRHLSADALPPFLDRLSSGTKSSEAGK
jgi:hypothetical protein